MHSLNIDSRLLFMLLVRHHAKHMPSHEYLTSALIKHIYDSVHVEENVIKCAYIFSSFVQWFCWFYAKIGIKHDFVFH